MNIVLFYGPGEVSKRAEIVKIRKQFAPDAVTVVDFKQDGMEKLHLALTSIPLFESEKRLVVAENVSEKLDLYSLPQADNGTTLTVVAGDCKPGSTILQSAHKLKSAVVSFGGEKELSAFPFIDSLMEQKAQAFVELEKLLDEYGGMYVLAMIYYGLRRNILPLPAAPFIRKKIEMQKRRFHPEDWARLYELALKAEFGIKSGKAPEKLVITHLVQEIRGRF